MEVLFRRLWVRLSRRHCCVCVDSQHLSSFGSGLQLHRGRWQLHGFLQMHTRDLGSHRRHLCKNLRPLLAAEHVADSIFDALCLCQKKRNTEPTNSTATACSCCPRTFGTLLPACPSMTFLVEAARSWVEMFLGWAMLVPYSQTCRGAVTESTWSQLEGLLRERGRPRQAFVRHVGRYYGQLVGGIRHLANVPPETVCPVVARRNGGFPRAEPLRRVRVQHATVWAAPVGLPQLWRDWRDAFLTRGYDPLVTRFERDPPQACAGWRQVTRRQLTEDVCAWLSCRTCGANGHLFGGVGDGQRGDLRRFAKLGAPHAPATRWAGTHIDPSWHARTACGATTQANLHKHWTAEKQSEGLFRRMCFATGGQTNTVFATHVCQQVEQSCLRELHMSPFMNCLVS